MAINDFVKQFIDNSIKRDKATHESQINSDTLDWLESQPGPNIVLAKQAMGGHANGSVFSVNNGATWHRSIAEAVRQEIARAQLGV